MLMTEIHVPYEDHKHREENFLRKVITEPLGVWGGMSHSTEPFRGEGYSHSFDLGTVSGASGVGDAIERVMAQFESAGIRDFTITLRLLEDE